MFNPAMVRFGGAGDKEFRKGSGWAGGDDLNLLMESRSGQRLPFCELRACIVKKVGTVFGASPMFRLSALLPLANFDCTLTTMNDAARSATELTGRLDLLEATGERVVQELVRANARWMCDPGAAAVRAGLSTSGLATEQEEGRIIAYRPGANAECTYPIEQFRDGRVEPWAAEIIHVVGNGGAAVHFLFVARGSLNGRSVADVVRLDPGDVGAALVRRYLSPLRSDGP